MADNTFSYPIETDVPAKFTGNLMDFIYQKYLQPQTQRYADISRKMIEGDPSITFTTLDPMGKRNLNVEVRGSRPIKLTITRLDYTVPDDMIKEAKQDVGIVVNAFEEGVRKSTLFFAWREGEGIVPEKLHRAENKSTNRLFLETQILLFVVFIAIGSVLFFALGPLVPLVPFVLLGLQLLFVFYSSKFVARTADWHITAKNPTIHFLEYHRPLDEHDTFRQTFSGDKLMELKKDVYKETIADRGHIDPNTAQQIFLRHGINCEPDDLTAKQVNVYELVKTTADKFRFPVPEIVVANTMLPNAAASGPSPSRGVVLITTGLLVQLDNDEILSVLGHEFGHLKGRDPLYLFGLTAVQYLLLFYVVYPIIAYSLLFFFVYFWISLTVVYFIAKFFEARADLISAMVIGQPQVLAKALEKIGFKALLYERTPAFRFQEWLSANPHPPIYFRIDRLEKIKPPIHISHPLIQSAREVTRGSLRSF